jgi:hypothetical protein
MSARNAFISSLASTLHSAAPKQLAFSGTEGYFAPGAADRLGGGRVYLHSALSMDVLATLSALSMDVLATVARSPGRQLPWVPQHCQCLPPLTTAAAVAVI